MKPYIFLPHTADVKFQAFGTTLEEAFENAALATIAVMTEDKVESKIEKTFQIEPSSASIERLLYMFLESILFEIDTEGFLVGEVAAIEIKKIGGFYTLFARVLGDSADNYEVTTHIKAVTYHDMFIKEEENMVRVQVVHDI
jgi:SHS2 domain-containing protein